MYRVSFFAILLAGLLHSAVAGELLKDGKIEGLEKGAAVAPSSTLSGYPMYGGGGGWTFLRSSTGEAGALGNAEPVKTASLDVEQIEPDGSWFAIMFLRVNASTVGTAQYTTGSPCKGNFTYVVDKSVRTDDNCQALKASSYKSGTSERVYLSLLFTHTASAGRRIFMELRLNPELLGFRGTTTDSWSAESVAQNPARQKFIERLKQFGTKLQEANQSAIRFDKPKDAYAGVPSYRTLMDVSEDLADGTFSQQFIGAVESVRYAPGYKAIAYSKWGGNRISWNSVDEEESEAVAASKALENCTKNKRTEGTPCVLYDLKAKQNLMKTVTTQ
ncbi:hypothetical protein [Rhodoferax saidenbachensis]|uniref:DUF4189 domain-containing protein n=1 Tax=Rhodoferax saidenbachensis TaxID=1484693 RepID=A0A1P8K7I2_9BURK|nr:hypothetical protein [Rhodoferax saidenbachensis]APW41982.1 hypothetical protein RS694_05125 [Rhodoferax saidenbachensis]